MTNHSCVLTPLGESQEHGLNREMKPQSIQSISEWEVSSHSGGCRVQCYVTEVVSFSSLPLPFYTQRVRGAEPRSSVRPPKWVDLAMVSGVFPSRAGRDQLDRKVDYCFAPSNSAVACRAWQSWGEEGREPDSPKEPRGCQ